MNFRFLEIGGHRVYCLRNVDCLKVIQFQLFGASSKLIFQKPTTISSISVWKEVLFWQIMIREYSLPLPRCMFMVDGMNLVLALLPLCSIVHALLPFKSCSRAENQSLTTVRKFEFEIE